MLILKILGILNEGSPPSDVGGLSYMADYISYSSAK